MASAELSRDDRLLALLDHLGLDRVHVAACMSADWGALATRHAERIHSLTVVAPYLNKGIPDGLSRFPSPALVVTGDDGAPAQRARSLATAFPRCDVHVLLGYASPPWADTVADRTAEIAKILRQFTTGAERAHAVPPAALAETDGEAAGITYRIRGAGRPLLLLPLGFAPSQWEPLVSRLAKDCCTITAGGAFLGVVALLEERARSGYGRLVAQTVDQAAPAPGETILEVGCGTGALARPLAQRTSKRNPIVGADINRYLLSEARSLAVREGLGDAIAFEEGDATALPYDAGRFDIAVSSTVLEEGDADRMLAELARVTRPGGRVVVLTRAIDVDWWPSLPVPGELRARIGALGPATGAGVNDDGCADASLYARVRSAGLTPLSMGPQFAIYDGGERLTDVMDRLLAQLPPDDAALCRDAAQQAAGDGTLFLAEPFHCAVCMKPDG